MIYVDAALWPFRGERWCHLVSDHSYEELHLFAQRIGKRRVGFQGDHYDLRPTERSRAIDAGAEVVDSRVLVKRLRDAGLRNRAGLPDWSVVHEGPVAAPRLATLMQRFDLEGSVAGIQDVIAVGPANAAVDVVLLRRPATDDATSEVGLVVRGLRHDQLTVAPPTVMRDGRQEIWLGHDGEAPVVELLTSIVAG